MRPRSILGARYTMRATILRRTGDGAPPVDTGEIGSWEEYQDPMTGEIVKQWQPVPVDEPGTPDVDESLSVADIWCMARGIVDGGIRAAASTQDFNDDIYRNIDIINMWVPKKYLITKGDRVTNIRSRDGSILWRDEELEGPTDVRATVFNVNGVIPVLDLFNHHIDNFCLLERVEV